jgi:dienelactone hydrolase
MVQKKILYLHGLDGSLSQEKEEVLKRHFEIVAPQLDYKNMPDMFGTLSSLVVSGNVDAIIGNSMGGCFACYLSAHYSLPALCFNPALAYRPIDIILPELKPDNSFVVFVLGGKDDLIPAVENFAWIRQNPNPNFVLKWYNTMGHRVDIDTFEKEVELFTLNLSNV